MPKKTNKTKTILDLLEQYPAWGAAEIAKKVKCTASHVYKIRKDWINAFDLTPDMEEPPTDMNDLLYTITQGTQREAADPVNSPPHYTDGGIETIDYIRAKLSEEEFSGYCRGNALKYLSRAGKKGAAAEDHRKAVWYLSYLEDHAA